MNANEAPARPLSARELGRQLGISTRRIARLVEDGRIPYFEIPSGRPLFCLTDVLEALRVAPSTTESER